MKREELIAPENYNIVEEVERHAKGPEKQALLMEDISGETYSLTYQELIKRANKIGNAFKESGLRKGDKIIIMMPRQIATYEIYLAALKTGIIIIPSSEMLKTKDLQYRVEHGEVQGIVSYYSSTDQFESIKEYNDLYKFVVGQETPNWMRLETLMDRASDELDIVPTKRDDIAFLPYTSGTTGNPKGVIHTHGWGFAHLKTAAENWLSISSTDRVWATAGPGWQKWVWSPFLSVLGIGATGFLYNGKFDAEKYLQLLQHYRINVLCCTPTEYRIISKIDNLDKYSLPDLHSAVSAGEPLNVEVIDTFRRQFNITVRDGYGQTENTLLLGFLKDTEVKAGSMGKPTPGNEVEIVDEEGRPQGPGKVGDIAVTFNCPALFSGYFKDPERTQRSKRGNYYITGDQASKDEDGYFWFEGRSDDVIISSGYTIGPFEVEDALTKHPAVRECAVVASPDATRGNIVKAFIVARKREGDDVLIKELQDHVKSLTGPYKYPREIEFVDQLPKTTSGKIRRIELRNQEHQS